MTSALSCQCLSSTGCRVLLNRARRRMLCRTSLPPEALKALPAPYDATLGPVQVLWDTGASGRSRHGQGHRTGNSPGRDEFFPPTFLYLLRYSHILEKHLLLHESFPWVEKNPQLSFSKNKSESLTKIHEFIKFLRG